MQVIHLYIIAYLWIKIGVRLQEMASHPNA